MTDKPKLLRTARLLSANPSDRGTIGFSTSLAYEPISGENKKGTLYIVIEVMTLIEQGREIAEKIIDTAKAEYFKDTEPIPARAFENTLIAINDGLTDLAESGRIAWVGKINALVAIITEGEIHLAKTGSADAYLFRREATSHISEELNSTEQSEHPIKTFSNIIAGELFIGDKLLFTTPGLFYHLSLTELHNILIDHTPGGAISYIARLLEKATRQRTSLMIVEATTPEILTYEISGEEPTEIILNESRGASPSIIKAAPAINFLTGVLSKVLSLFRLERRDVSFKIPRFKPKEIFTRSALKSKATLVFLAVAVLIFSVVFTNISGKNAAVKKTAEKAFSEIKTLVSDGDSNSFTDRSLAVKNYQQALVKIEPLLTSPILKKEAIALKKDVEEKLRSVKGVYETNEEQIADLNAVLPGTAVAVYLVKKKLYAFDSNGTIVSTDLLSKEVIQLHNQPIKGKVLDVAYDEKAGNFYILTDAPQVYTYGLTGNTLKKTKIAVGAWPKGTKIDVYPVFGNTVYMYVLAPSAKKIYSFISGSGTFTAPNNYFENSKIKASTDLAVDTFVYDMTSSASIIKLSRGQKFSFTLKPLDKLTKAQNILLNRILKNIYIYDGAANTITVFNKKGTYLQANTVKNPGVASFAVDETKKVYYLLAGKQLFVKNLQP